MLKVNRLIHILWPPSADINSKIAYKYIESTQLFVSISRIHLLLSHVLEKRGVKLRLQLLVSVFVHNVSYLLFSADMWSVVGITFQPFPSADIDDRLPH